MRIISSIRLVLAVSLSLTFSGSAESGQVAARPNSDHNVTVGEDVEASRAAEAAAQAAAAGDLDQAVRLASTALEARDRLFGRDHPDTIASLASLGELYTAAARYSEAEARLVRALDAAERTLGPEHPTTVRVSANLGTLYSLQGRYVEAEPILRRVVEIRERTGGINNVDTIDALSRLGSLFFDEERYEETEEAYARALRASETVLGPEHPLTLRAINNIAAVYGQQGRFAEAEPLYRRAIEGSSRVSGRESLATLRYSGGLAYLYSQQGRIDEAEPLFRRTLAGFDRLLGADHPDTLRAAERFTEALLSSPTRARDALGPARQLLGGLHRRRETESIDLYGHAQRIREMNRDTSRFTLYADAAWENDRNAIGSPAMVFTELQYAITGSGSDSVARIQARRAAADQDPALAQLMVEFDQLEEQWKANVRALEASFFEAGDQTALRARLAADRETLEARVAAIIAEMRRTYASYFQLIQQTPVWVLAAQEMLEEDEAILLAVPTRFGTHVVVVTDEGVRWNRATWNADQVATAVRRLRWDVGAVTDVTQAEQTAWREESPPGGPATFDRQTAYALYQQLIAPVADAFAGKRRLFTSASGILSSLPFSILVTQAPRGSDGDPSALRATSWFADAHVLIHVPSIHALDLSRRQYDAYLNTPPPEPATGFTGFGDPVLNGAPAPRVRGSGSSFTAQQVHRGRVRSANNLMNARRLSNLPRLPGTARELEAVRRALRAPESSVHIGAAATETEVRSMDLSRSRYLLFSTHGLTSDEAIGVGEPGLVLTPPNGEPSAADDGYLAASEAAMLRLNADWVVLSACNTATGDGANGQGLSALSRAFLYAGARSVLASHWPVSDDVAPVLIARTLLLVRRGTGPAEAFQQAMREIRMNTEHDTATDSWAHPFYWAPFVLIGNGND